MGRKYVDKDITTLEQMARGANEAGDTQALQLIRSELQYRSSKRAQDLAKAIDHIFAGKTVKIGGGNTKPSRGPRTVGILGPRPVPLTTPPKPEQQITHVHEDEQRDDVAEPNLSSWPAKKILSEISSLESEIQRISMRIAECAPAYRMTKSRLDDLNEDLEGYLEEKFPSLIHSHTPIETPATVIDARMNDLWSQQFDELKKQAIKTWPKHREWFQASSAARSSQQVLSALQQFHDQLNRRLRCIQEYMTVHRTQLTSDLENDLVIEIAEQMASGVSPLELLKEIERNPYVDNAVMILTRARLYMQNVLGKDSPGSGTR